MFPFNSGNYIKKVRSVRPDRLVALWPQNEPLGHAVSTEIIRGYDGAYTAVTLGGVGVPGSGLTSAGYDGATSYNDIYTAGFANDNGLANPGFETAGGAPPIWANWAENAGDGALANEVVIVHEGVDAAKVTSGATSDTYIYGAVTVIPGQRRRLRFWSQGDAVNAGRYFVWDATNGAYITPMASTGITAAAWGMVAVEYTVPAGCVLVHDFLSCPNVNGGIAYFDACEDRRIDGFLGDKGTILAVAQVANVGVWTDSKARNIVTFIVGAGDQVYIQRTAANNTVQFVYRAGGVLETQTSGALTSLDFVFYAMTWSKSDDEVRYYINGLQAGLTDTVLGTWVGDLDHIKMNIGASTTAPLNPWSGNIAAAAYWSCALAPEAIRYLFLA